jgi:hypothetical protein
MTDKLRQILQGDTSDKFYVQLFSLIALASFFDREKLYQIYPDAVNAYKKYERDKIDFFNH